MSVLITGGTGFLGLNLAENLMRRGEDVVLFSNGPLPPDAYAAFAGLAGVLHVVIGDIVDAAALGTVLGEYRPDQVIHAAAITSGAQRELLEINRIIDVNLKGTANLLNVAARSGVKRVVYVSSGSAYGASILGSGIVSETAQPQPDTLYSVTKYASERLCARFRCLRGTDIVSVRLASLFGPWEWDTGVRDSLSIPYQILLHAEQGAEIVLPRRAPRRDWLYSRDAAEAVIGILRARCLTHTLYNVSTTAEWEDFGESWCRHLQRLFPRLRYRMTEEGENPNVSFLGESDRMLMSNERLSLDTGFQAAFAGNNAFGDYLRWLEQQPKYSGSQGASA